MDGIKEIFFEIRGFDQPWDWGVDSVEQDDVSDSPEVKECQSWVVVGEGPLSEGETLWINEGSIDSRDELLWVGVPIAELQGLANDLDD